ncbi:MAG: uncharacterized protein A8A55_2756 [Amphiamblys sp. WSBS2006]|nr:MAG: uncharacterized protein A8A55_2756 [Amphiamblys sp. WSBS2006]
MGKKDGFLVFKKAKEERKGEYAELFQHVEDEFEEIKDAVKERAHGAAAEKRGGCGDRILALYSDFLSARTKHQYGEIFRKDGKRLLEHLRRESSVFVNSRGVCFWGDVESVLKEAEETRCSVVCGVLLGLFLLCRDTGTAGRKELWSLVCRMVGMSGKKEKGLVQRLVGVVESNVEGMKEKTVCFSRVFSASKGTRPVEAKKQKTKENFRQAKREIRKEGEKEMRRKGAEKRESGEKYKRKMNKIMDAVEKNT